MPVTKGEDGDPNDIVVISEFKSFTGWAIDVKIIGLSLLNRLRKKEIACATIASWRYR